MKRKFEFDEKHLESEGQQLMSKLVANTADEELSMAWRSSLNEKLLAAAAQKKKRERFGWVLRPAFGLAFAGALAAVVVMRTAPMTAVSRVPRSNGLEASLVMDHRQNALVSEVTGVGVNPFESHPTESISGGDPGAEFDLESL